MQFDKSTLIAVVGVSSNTAKYGYKIFSDLVKHQYQAYGINPNGGVVAGEKLYPSLSDLSQIPELVIFVVPPTVTLQVLNEIKKLHIKHIWFQPGSESKEVLTKAQSLGLDYIANACFMLNQRIWK